MSKTELWLSQSGSMQHFFMIISSCTSEYQRIKANFYVFLWTGDHNSDRFLFLLVVLVSTEHRRQLAFSHLLDSLFTCRHPSPTPPPLLSGFHNHSKRRHSSAHESSHWLQFDSWAVRGEWGVDRVELPKKTTRQRWAGCLVDVTMQLRGELAGIIFTLLDYFPRTPPTEWEGVKERILQDRERRRRGGECVSTNIYLWKAGC